MQTGINQENTTLVRACVKLCFSEDISWYFVDSNGIKNHFPVRDIVRPMRLFSVFYVSHIKTNSTTYSCPVWMGLFKFTDILFSIFKIFLRSLINDTCIWGVVFISAHPLQLRLWLIVWIFNCVGKTLRVKRASRSDQKKFMMMTNRFW